MSNDKQPSADKVTPFLKEKGVSQASKYNIWIIGKWLNEFADLKTKALQDELEFYKLDVNILQSANIEVKEQNKQLSEALTNLQKEAEDLMEFCIDRKYLDNEDLTDGQLLFDEAVFKSKEALTNYQKKN
jgi:hypothetical protein